MKLTRKSLKKSLELEQNQLELGYDQTEMPTEDYIALVQAHLEALEVIAWYADKEHWDWQMSYGRKQVHHLDCDYLILNDDQPKLKSITGGKRARAFLSKHGGAE